MLSVPSVVIDASYDSNGRAGNGASRYSDHRLGERRRGREV